jgi:hypothetical protein
MNKHARNLKILLILMGIAELCAIPAIFLPASVMASIHEQLGLGTFPEQAITPYLARCLSFFYAMHGGLLLLAAKDIRRYAGLITYIAYTGIVFSVLITIFDIQSGFPWYWTVGEGPFLTAISIAFLVLLKRADINDESGK